MPRLPLLRRLRGGALALLALVATAAWFAAPAVAAIDPDDLLPVDDAFALTASASGPDRIVLRWRIEDGYYLYRHRMEARVLAGDFEAGALQLPAGKRHVDEFFGEVETYRKSVEAVLPGTGSGTVTLQVKYQGCADLGICYPPQTRKLVVALPAAAAVDAAPPAAGLGGLLRRALPPSLLGQGDEPLPEARAFGFDAIARDAGTLLLRFTPAPGYYLYRDRTSIALAGPAVDSAGLSAGELQWPPGTRHEDEYFGTTTVYFEPVDVALPLRRTRAGGGELRVTASFQGCQDEGICYPPMTRTMDLVLPDGRAPDGPAAGTAPAANDTAASTLAPAAGDPIAAETAPTTPTATADPIAAEAAPAGPAGAASQGDDERLAAQLAGQGRGVALLLFLGAGLLLAFTPCVLPMIPILSGLIAGASAAHGGRLGTGRALALSSVYVLANALVFTAAGVVAGLVGANLQVAFQNPWVIMAFAALFVALALSMFGLYELQLPAALRARLGEVADRQHGGSWAGVAAMGALSALIVGPCVAPPLAAAVLYISQARDPVFGGAALFALAIGMGLPLLAFGVAAGRGLPHSGPWMIRVQRVFGFVFLGLAVWMLSRILPGAAALALWGVLALAAAAWAFGLVGGDASPRTRMIARFAGLALSVVGAAQLLGAWTGGSDPLRPLDGLSSAAPARKLAFRMVKSVDDLDREVAAARAAGKPVMFDFYADWCVACKEMEKYTFTEPQVHDALAGFVLLKADVTPNDAIDQALMRRFGIVGPPATLFFVDGTERRDLRLYGFEDAATFTARVERVPGAE